MIFKPFLRAFVGVAVLVALIASPLGRAGSAKATESQVELPNARTIVDRFVTAMGGETAFAKVTSIHATGTMKILQQGIGGTADLISGRPNKSLLVVEIAGVGRIETGYDGKVGWNIDPQSGPMLAKGEELTQMAEESWFDAPLRPNDHIREMATVEKTDFDNRPAYKIKIVYPSGHEKFEYFDVETGMDLGSEGKQATPMGSVPATEIFRDYKLFGDVKQATTIVTRVLGIEQMVTIDTCVYNTVAANAFDPPPAIKALIKGTGSGPAWREPGLTPFTIEAPGPAWRKPGLTH